MRLVRTLIVAMLGGLPMVGYCAGDEIDAALMAAINEIRAVDNHMHADAVDVTRP